MSSDMQSIMRAVHIAQVRIPSSTHFVYGLASHLMQCVAPGTSLFQPTRIPVKKAWCCVPIGRYPRPSGYTQAAHRCKSGDPQVVVCQLVHNHAT